MYVDLDGREQGFEDYYLRYKAYLTRLRSSETTNTNPFLSIPPLVTRGDASSSPTPLDPPTPTCGLVHRPRRHGESVTGYDDGGGRSVEKSGKVGDRAESEGKTVEAISKLPRIRGDHWKEAPRALLHRLGRRGESVTGYDDGGRIIVEKSKKLGGGEESAPKNEGKFMKLPKREPCDTGKEKAHAHVHWRRRRDESGTAYDDGGRIIVEKSRKLGGEVECGEKKEGKIMKLPKRERCDHGKDKPHAHVHRRRRHGEPGKEYDDGWRRIMDETNFEKTQYTDPTERPPDRKKLSSSPPSEQVREFESPYYTTLSIRINAGDTRNENHDHESRIESLNTPSLEYDKSGMPQMLDGVDTSPSLNQSTFQPVKDSDIGMEDEEEEEDSLNRADEESHDASREGEISVKSALSTAMGVVKGVLLRELVAYALPEARDALEASEFSTYGSNVGDTRSSTTSPSLFAGNSKAQTLQGTKRARESGGDPDDDGDNDDDSDDDRPKKKNENGSPDRPPHRRLKCPFYQRQPEKYRKAACRGEGFADMAKLKDHIKRVHTQPLQCCRCWIEMKSEDAYNEHLQQDEMCKKRTKPQDDRIPLQKVRQLDFKKAPYANASNVEEKWTMLFKVLFPNESIIPSPYEQRGMSPQLERALSEALEGELTRELEPILEPIMSRIKALVPAIIERCRLNLMREYESPDVETESVAPVMSCSVSNEIRKCKRPKHMEQQGYPTERRCSVGVLEDVAFSELFSTKAQRKRPPHCVLSASEISREDPYEASSTASSADLSVVYPDAPGHMPKACRKISNNPFRKEKDCFLSIPGSCPGEGNPLDAESQLAKLAAFTNPTGTVHLPPSLSSTWSLLGAERDGAARVEGQPEVKDPDPTISREQESLLGWDAVFEDFDFPHFPNY